MTEKKYVIAPYVRCGFLGDKLIVGFASIEKQIDNPETFEPILDLMIFLQTPRTLKQLEEYINQTGTEPKTANELYDFFVESRFLIEENIYIPDERYSRHLLFYNLSEGSPTKIQKNIENSKIAILGCGGIGNLVAVNLAMAGVKNLYLIDHDTIEISNLTRQIFYQEKDVGKYKVDILKNIIQERASYTKIITLKEKFVSESQFEQIKDSDLILISGDSPNVVNNTNDFAFKNNIPFLNAGYILDIAVWGPLIVPGKTPCIQCFNNQNIVKNDTNKDLVDKLEAINSKFQSPSHGPINMLASSMATLDILKYIGKFGQVECQNKRVGIWTHSLKKEYQYFTKEKQCNICNKEPVY